MDCLMLFGFISTFLTLVFFIYQHQSRSALQMFAICLAAMAAYGLLQGAWGLGIIVATWSGATWTRRNW